MQKTAPLPPIAAIAAAKPPTRKPELDKLKNARLFLEEEQTKNVNFRMDFDKVNLLKDSANYRTEREIGLQHFKELLTIFQKAAATNGDGSVSKSQFKQHFSTILGSDLSDVQMDHLFCKIDTDTDNMIDWNDFSTFMLMRAEGQKQMREDAENQLYEIDPIEMHRLPIQTSHRDLIQVVLYIEKLKRYITVGRDETVCYWNEKFKLIRKYRQEEIDAKTETSHKETSKSKKLNRWIHDCVFLGNTNKLAFASDDHCISFHDFTTMICDVKLNIGDQIPLSLDVWYDTSQSDADDKTLLVFGTDAGYVVTIKFHNNFLFDPQKQRKTQVTFLNLDQVIKQVSKLSGGEKKDSFIVTKRKAHDDWCVKVKYYESLQAILSCSPDPNNSLSLALYNQKKWTATTLSVHKGVNTFAYCKFPSALVTGGTDRQLRIWNVHRFRSPLAALKGHVAPIIEIVINESYGQIISLSTDKVIKIWDIRQQVCIQTLVDPFTHRPENTISTILFNPFNNPTLVAGSNTITPYQLKKKQSTTNNNNSNRDKIPKSHEFPLRGALYNHIFHQIVSADDGGIINVWDPNSGQKTFRIRNTSAEEEITAMTFDNNYRRLITGGRKGSLIMWNFNNGQILHKLEGQQAEITGILYIEMKECQWVIVSGWDKRIYLFKHSERNFIIRPDVICPEPSQPPFHTDDIISMTYQSPNVLATGTVNGEINVMNLVTGHFLCKFSEKLGSPRQIPGTIDKLLYLKNRNTEESADLVSIGSDGKLRFWNTDTSTLMGEFECTAPGESIQAMCTDSLYSVIVTGDSMGWISVWDIKETCMVSSNTTEPFEAQPPIMPHINSFRAHVKTIMSLEIVGGMVLTASIDSTVRMFSLQGEYVGTYGQPDVWDMYNPETFQHPLVPLDVITAEIEICQDEETFFKLKEMAHRILTKKTSRKQAAATAAAAAALAAGHLAGDGGATTKTTTITKTTSKKLGKPGVLLSGIAKTNSTINNTSSSLKTIDDTTSLSNKTKLININNDSCSSDSDYSDTADEYYITSSDDDDDNNLTEPSRSTFLKKKPVSNVLLSTSNETSSNNTISNDLNNTNHHYHHHRNRGRVGGGGGGGGGRVLPKTADLLKKGYRTWYATSLYVNENNHRPNYTGTGKIKGQVVVENGRVYHSLKPVELGEVINPRRN